MSKNIEGALKANEIPTDKFLVYLINNGFAPSEAHYFLTENFTDVLEVIANTNWSMLDGAENYFTITFTPRVADIEEGDQIERLFKHMLSIRFKKIQIV